MNEWAVFLLGLIIGQAHTTGIILCIWCISTINSRFKVKVRSLGFILCTCCISTIVIVLYMSKSNQWKSYYLYVVFPLQY